MIFNLKSSPSALTLSGLLWCGSLSMIQSVSAQNQPMIVAQNNQFQQHYGQMNQYSALAYNEILPFLTGLSQMENVATDEELLTLMQQLNPIANRITNNFAQSYQAGEKIIPPANANNPQNEYLRNVININGIGYNTFSPWTNIFNQILTAYQKEDAEMLQSALLQMPPAVEQIMNFADQTQAVINQGNQVVASMNNTPPVTSSNTQNYSAMSGMMHQSTMSILSNMGSGGEWRYNYGTGQDEFYQF